MVRPRTVRKLSRPQSGSRPGTVPRASGGSSGALHISPETGNKEDVRWASLINEDGDGLLIVPDTPLSFSALPFTSDDLDQAKHQHELISKDEVFVSIDFKQNGLGNKSCGPEPLEMYLLHPRPVRFGYSLRPISGTREKPEVLARFVFDPKLANAHLDAEETRNGSWETGKPIILTRAIRMLGGRPDTAIERSRKEAQRTAKPLSSRALRFIQFGFELFGKGIHYIIHASPFQIDLGERVCHHLRSGRKSFVYP